MNNIEKQMRRTTGKEKQLRTQSAEYGKNTQKSFVLNAHCTGDCALQKRSIERGSCPIQACASSGLPVVLHTVHVALHALDLVEFCHSLEIGLERFLAQ